MKFANLLNYFVIFTTVYSKRNGGKHTEKPIEKTFEKSFEKTFEKLT